MSIREVVRVRSFAEADYEAFARILILCIPTRPTTAENERGLDEDTPAQYRHQRWTAEDESGVLGVCEYQQNHRTRPDCYLLRLIVDPGQKGRGIESKLFGECTKALFELGAREFRTTIPFNAPDVLAFFRGSGLLRDERFSPDAPRSRHLSHEGMGAEDCSRCRSGVSHSSALRSSQDGRWEDRALELASGGIGRHTDGFFAGRRESRSVLPSCGRASGSPSRYILRLRYWRRVVRELWN